MLRKKIFRIHPEGQVRGVLAVIARLHINGQLIASVDLCKTRQAGANVIGVLPCRVLRSDHTG